MQVHQGYPTFHPVPMRIAGEAVRVGAGVWGASLYLPPHLAVNLKPL